MWSNRDLECAVGGSGWASRRGHVGHRRASGGASKASLQGSTVEMGGGKVVGIWNFWNSGQTYVIALVSGSGLYQSSLSVSSIVDFKEAKLLVTALWGLNSGVRSMCNKDPPFPSVNGNAGAQHIGLSEQSQDVLGVTAGLSGSGWFGLLSRRGWECGRAIYLYFSEVVGVRRILTVTGESLSEAWTCFKDLLQKVPYHGIDLWLQVQIFYDHVTPVTRRTIDQSANGKLRDRNAEETWALLEDLALYDNKS
ncbi:hypothetical protein Tco_1302436 [Tanacetum coccineum]